MNDKNYGVIQEQGFVVGNGLGFQPVKENELNPQTAPQHQTPNKTQEPQKTKESK